MSALRAKRALEASFLARQAVAGSAPFSAASLRPGASTASRTFLRQQRKHLSGTATTTFEYKPLFQYDATARDDPPEVCACVCACVCARVEIWFGHPVLPGSGKGRGRSGIRHVSKGPHNGSLQPPMSKFLSTTLSARLWGRQPGGGALAPLYLPSQPLRRMNLDPCRSFRTNIAHWPWPPAGYLVRLPIDGCRDDTTCRFHRSFFMFSTAGGKLL